MISRKESNKDNVKVQDIPVEEKFSLADFAKKVSSRIKWRNRKSYKNVTQTPPINESDYLDVQNN